jgi:hypothetical protein
MSEAELLLGILFEFGRKAHNSLHKPGRFLLA